MKSIFRVICMITLGAVLMVGGALPLSAQETKSEEFTLEEITVTAERHEADLQALASSVTVQNGDEMLQQGRSSLTQMLQEVPGIMIQTSDNDKDMGQDNEGVGITIRGVMPNGPTYSSSISLVPATAVYLDGVYEGVGNSYDVNRVEILRGPQGTLYGRSATGGVVAIHTNDPVLGAYNGNISAEIGNYNLKNIQAALNIPVADTFAIRAAVHEYKRDGYFAKEGSGNIDKKEGRIKMLYKPNDDLSILLGAALQYNRLKSGGYTFYMEGTDKFRFEPKLAGSGRNHYQQYWAQIDWNVGIGTLTYLPAFRSWWRDQASVVILPFGTLTSPAYRPKDDFWTHELRLASNPGSAVTWQTGIFYYDNQLEAVESVRIIPNNYDDWAFDETKQTKNIGAFAEATYPFSDTLRLTAGLRYDYTHIAVEEAYSVYSGALTQMVTAYLTGDAGKRTYRNWTYKLRLEKDLTPSNLMYVSVSTGFLPGDVNVMKAGDPPYYHPEAFEYVPETLTAYEIGAKNRFLDNKLQVNGAVFFYDYGGYQSIVDLAGSPFETPNMVMFNEAARMWGGEIETLFQVTIRDRLSASINYVRGEFTDPDAFYQTLVAQKQFTGIPPWQGTLGYDHMFDLPGGSILTMHGDASFQTGYDVSQVRPKMIEAGYLAYAQNEAMWFGNLNVTWTSSNSVYSITGYVRNLSDKQYKLTAPQTITSQSQVYASTVYMSDPRTYGVVLSAKF